MEFSERLIKYIDEKGITVKELAEEMGIPISSLKVWVENDTIPSIKWQGTLEKFFSLSAKELGIEHFCKRCGKALKKQGTIVCPQCAEENKRNWRKKAVKTTVKKPYPPDKRCTHCRYWDKAISDKGGCLQILEKGHTIRKTDCEGNCMCYESKNGGKKRENTLKLPLKVDSYVICQREFERL